MEQSNQNQRPAANQPPDQTLRAVSEKLSIYYSNCAMLSTTPVDLSLYFGRLTPVNREGGQKALVEYYEHQVIMTVEQARNLATALTRTAEMMEEAKQADAQQSRPPSAEANRARPARHEPDIELEVPEDDLAYVRRGAPHRKENTSRGPIMMQAGAQPGKPQKL